jgi:hypothetical protein
MARRPREACVRPSKRDDGVLASGLRRGVALITVKARGRGRAPLPERGPRVAGAGTAPAAVMARLGSGFGGLAG